MDEKACISDISYKDEEQYSSRMPNSVAFASKWVSGQTLNKGGRFHVYPVENSDMSFKSLCSMRRNMVYSRLSL